MLKKASLALAVFSLTANIATAQSFLWDKPEHIYLPGGDTLVLDRIGIDTFTVIDVITEEIIVRRDKVTEIVKFNSTPIYRYAQVKKPARKFLRGDVQKVLNRKLRKDIEEAWNFFGHIEIIVNEQGKIVYNDITLYPTDLSGTTSKPVDSEKSDRIKNNITQKLSSMHFRPAKKDGKKVAYHAMFY